MKPGIPCKNLRTKKLFIPALAAESFNPDRDETGSSGHCWCNCTLTETGPDDRLVSAQACTPERSCYEQ
jgi:hypothetical protein